MILPHLHSKPTRKCVPSGLEGSKVIPLPKNSKAPFTGSYSQPFSLLPTLCKLFEKIQRYFTVIKLTDFQYAYSEGYSKSTALTQFTDDRLRDIYDFF